MLYLDEEKLSYSFKSPEDLLNHLGYIIDCLVKDYFIAEGEELSTDVLKDEIVRARCATVLVPLMRADCFLSNEALAEEGDLLGDKEGEQNFGTASSFAYTKKG